MTILRHSSRRGRLDTSLLTARLSSAVSYDRIAGYFLSSLLEVAGEALEKVSGKVRVVCNSDLENAIVPATGEPYLKPVRVCLFGEGDDEAVPLPPYLQNAYDAAQEFCRLLGQRVQGGGFLKTLLRRRMGSSRYAGGVNSGILIDWQFKAYSRDEIKAKVKRGEIRLLIGTDAASEGLNLQRPGSLVNLDWPWNPTRLEQRKGRIQRIGQISETQR